MVQAELVGDSIAGNNNPDFQIQLAGNVNLTAANFALTGAQSSADLSAGVALRLTSVGNSATLHELAYTNVQNRAYSSFTEIFPAGSSVMAAEAFDNSQGSGSLTVSGANVAFTDSGSTQSVTVAGSTIAITAHASEIVSASGANDSFVFKNAFGQDTINGFGGSDTLQLQKSSFSYLNAASSQSADLAAVLGHASSGSNSITLADSAGDHLTLNGMTSTMLLAAPAGQITFV
jgi:hypothetical protein